MKHLTLYCLCLFTVLCCGCLGPARKNPQPPVVSDAQEAAALARWNDTTRAELEQGRAVVMVSCTKCHGYPAPGEETPGEWPAVAKRMAKKAKLDAIQTRQVLRYLVSASEVAHSK